MERRAEAGALPAIALATALYACALVGYRHEAMATSVAEAAVRIADKFSARQVSNLLWAWAKLQLPRDQFNQLCKALVPVLVAAAQKMRAVDISNITWAMVTKSTMTLSCCKAWQLQ